MSSAVGLYGLGEMNEAVEQLEDFCLEHEMALATSMPAASGPKFTIL